MLSIIVPAFNEGSRIYDNLKIISSALSGFTDDYEIIAVNDGSSDNTGDEIRRAASEDSRIISAGYHSFCLNGNIHFITEPHCKAVIFTVVYG